MKSRPPLVATWLLRTLGSGSDIEALLGDLSEAFLAGRSRVWFWSQVLIAIPITFVDTVRAHPILTVRALAVGWLAVSSLRYLTSKAVAFIEIVGYLDWRRIDIPAYRIVEGVKTQAGTIPMDSWQLIYLPVLVIISAFLIGFIACAIVASTQTRMRITALLAFMAMLAVLSAYRYASIPAPAFEIDSDVRIPDAWWFSLSWIRWGGLFSQWCGLLLGGLRFSAARRSPL